MRRFSLAVRRKVSAIGDEGGRERRREKRRKGYRFIRERDV